MGIPAAQRCTATSKTTGKRCGQWAVTGCNVCHYHGGKAPQVRKAVEVRAAKMAAHSQAERMVARAGVDADPIEHLVDSLHRASALVEVWGSMVASLDDAAERENQEDVRGGLGYTEDTDPKSPYELNVVSRDRMLALNRHGEAQLHPYIVEYEKWLVNRAKFAKLCIDAGVAERQIKLYEQQAEIAYGAFEAGLAVLKLSKPQQQEARRAYADTLRAL